jgi:hypothetical protein
MIIKILIIIFIIIMIMIIFIFVVAVVLVAALLYSFFLSFYANIFFFENETTKCQAQAAAAAAQAAGRRGRKRRLCVANTHIYWDPEFEDVKLWQTWVLCQELEKLVSDRQLPILLCGDFNSMPDSAVYDLLCADRYDPYSRPNFSNVF